VTRRAALLLAVAVAAVAVGCGASSSHRVASRVQRGPDPHVDHRLPGRHYVAGCEDPRVTGGLPPDYRRDSVVAGPLALYPARREWAGLTDFAPRAKHPNRYPPLDMAATVAPGARVTVTIPRGAERRLALLFDARQAPDSSGGYTIQQGDRAVTLPGCFRPYTQYSGGLVASWPQCVRLRIQPAGGKPLERTVRIGRRNCGVP
jgi:hypothetical protein